MVLCSRPSGKVKLSSFTSQSCKTAKKCTKIVLHVQSCCFANLNRLLLWRSRCHRRRCLGPAPSTRIRIFLNPQLFLCVFGFRPHVSGVSDIRIHKFLNPLSRVEIFNTPRILKTVPSRMLSLLYFLDFSSYNVYAVKPSYDYCTPQLC